MAKKRAPTLEVAKQRNNRVSVSRLRSVAVRHLMSLEGFIHVITSSSAIGG
jgi:hypothetical protein